MGYDRKYADADFKRGRCPLRRTGRTKVGLVTKIGPLFPVPSCLPQLSTIGALVSSNIQVPWTTVSLGPREAAQTLWQSLSQPFPALPLVNRSEDPVLRRGHIYITIARIDRNVDHSWRQEPFRARTSLHRF